MQSGTREGLKVVGVMCGIGAVIVFFLWVAMRSACCAEAQPVVVTKYEGQLLVLEREAVNDAFRQKITQLWTVWMSDDKGQPARALIGAAQARKAFSESMHEIERREQENNKR